MPFFFLTEMFSKFLLQLAELHCKQRFEPFFFFKAVQLSFLYHSHLPSGSNDEVLLLDVSLPGRC